MASYLNIYNDQLTRSCYFSKASTSSTITFNSLSHTTSLFFLFHLNQKAFTILVKAEQTKATNAVALALAITSSIERKQKETQNKIPNFALSFNCS